MEAIHSQTILEEAMSLSHSVLINALLSELKRNLGFHPLIQGEGEFEEAD
jgi:hypothetical protein